MKAWIPEQGSSEMAGIAPPSGAPVDLLLIIYPPLQIYSNVCTQALLGVSTGCTNNNNNSKKSSTEFGAIFWRLTFCPDGQETENISDVYHTVLVHSIATQYSLIEFIWQERNSC